MKIAAIIARILLGLIFVVFGLNGFLHFIPIPAPETEHAKAFMGALFGSGYGTYVKGLEVLGGALILSGRFTPLGLLIIGPILVNIILYHWKMMPGNLPLVLVMSVCSIILLMHHKREFGPFIGK